MFEDFDGKRGARDRRRFGVSLLVSAVVYLGVFGSAVLATAAVRKIVQEEKLVQVEFKQPPPEPPPPPPPEPAQVKEQKVVSTAPARAKVVRNELKAPDEIPDEKPEEAEGDLPDAPDPGEGRDGFLTGVVGGTGTAAHAPTPAPPPPKPRMVKPSAPIRNADTAFPEYPRAARRAGTVGTVVARIHVRIDGSVGKVEILDGPEVFHDSVREALMTWRYKPAQLSDGSAVADTHIVRIPFKLN